MNSSSTAGKETLGEFTRRMGKQLEISGIEDSLREARLILAEALDLPLSLQYLNEKEEIREEFRVRAEAVFTRRSRREPLSSIMEAKDFYGYRFRLNEACLAPRPETEELVNAALELLEKQGKELNNISLAEWCCGSGAPGLSLLAELKKRNPKLEISLDLSDISERALEAARDNAKALNLYANCHFEKTDLFPAVLRRYDIILCNPPYIPSEDIKSLMPEVKGFEPNLCLDGGTDGLVFYRRLAKRAHEYLAVPGALIMEHGIGQSDDIKWIFEARKKSGDCYSVRKDLSGLDRVAVLQTFNTENGEQDANYR